MAIDSHYIPAFSIEDVILDKDTGAPLSGGLVYFEQDNQRGILKPVYQITGTSPNYSYTQLPNPMVLSSIGTFQDSLDNPVIPYFYPYDDNLDPEYYYIRVTSSEGVFQFAREAQPYLGNPDDNSIGTAYDNEISNPQFSQVLFDTSTPTYVYNFNAAAQEVVPLAPDWDLVVSCIAAGSVTVSQLNPTGSVNVLTNPGTLLTITSAGLSRLRLRQRLYGSPNLWGSGYLAASFVAKTYGGVDTTITMYYSQSDGTIVDEPIIVANISSDGLYQAYPGSLLIPASNSSDNYPDAYVDIELNLPLNTQVDVTSIMLASTGETSIEGLVYDQETRNRQIDHLFHYYKQGLDFKPIPSMLVAWDFPLNPAQARGTSLNITTTAAYTWDQTICKSVVGNVAVIRSAYSGGFQATTANADEAFYMLQYLDGGEAREIIGNELSVNINAFRTQSGGDVTCKVYLYSARLASSFPILPTSLGTIDADGVFTLTAANWTLIPRGNQGQANGTLPSINTADYTTLNDVQDLKFNGWQLDDSGQISDTTRFAIVVTFSCPTTGTIVTTDSISMVKGSVPTRPAAQTQNAVIEECEYYYEKSYDTNAVPGTASALNGFMTSAQTIFNATSVYAADFTLDFNTIKRSAAPLVNFYNFGGGINTVSAQLVNSGGTIGRATINIAPGSSSLWAQTYLGQKSATYQPVSTAAMQSVAAAQSIPSGWIEYHYTVDARPGVVV